MARFVSGSDPALSSVVPAGFVARAAAYQVGSPRVSRDEALGGEPVVVGRAAAAQAVAAAVSAQRGWEPRDLVARSAAAAADAGLPAGSFLVQPSAGREPFEILSWLVQELSSSNGSLAWLESKRIAALSVLRAFSDLGLLSTADLALVRAEIAAVAAAVAAEISAAPLSY